MRLWTLQNEEVYNAIMQEGKYHCIESKSENLESRHFKRSYKWLVGEMEKRIGKAPKGIDYPVWAWLRKPDLRSKDYAPCKGIFYRIEFEIDPKDVLCTDFNHWHCVLNYSPLITIEDLEEWNAEYDRIERLMPVSERIRIIEESWNGVIYDGIPETNRLVQVTFWELRKEQIKKIEKFYSK